MSEELELDPADYHLRLMIERMQREGRSEAAIDKAVRIACGWKRRAKKGGTQDTRATAHGSTAAGQSH